MTSLSYTTFFHANIRLFPFYFSNNENLIKLSYITMYSFYKPSPKPITKNITKTATTTKKRPRCPITTSPTPAPIVTTTTPKKPLPKGVVVFPPEWEPPTDLRHTGPTYFCADEAGRGALAGYMSLGVVAMPSDVDEAKWSCVKDSKSYKNTKGSTASDKRLAARKIIEEHAAAYVVVAASVDTIDRLNVTQAGYLGIHLGCEWMMCASGSDDSKTVVATMEKEGFWVVAGRSFNTTREEGKEREERYHPRIDGILMDGKGFKPLVRSCGEVVPYATYTKGDARVLGIAAASVLAKSHRDDGMSALATEFPELDNLYEISTNKGYAAFGADKSGGIDHRKAIAEHGFTLSHRLSYNPVKSLHVAGQLANPIGRRGAPRSISAPPSEAKHLSGAV